MSAICRLYKRKTFYAILCILRILWIKVSAWRHGNKTSHAEPLAAKAVIVGWVCEESPSTIFVFF
jgi:hypothetical protein